MNDTVGSIGTNNTINYPKSDRIDSNSGNVGESNGRKLTLSNTNSPNRRNVSSTDNGEKGLDLVSDSKKIALSHENPVPMSDRKMRSTEGSGIMRDYKKMMRAINDDLDLKEVQNHIDYGYTTVTEMLGMDPATQEELQHLVSSLNKFNEKLDEAAEKLFYRQPNLSEDPTQNPVPFQREAIKDLKNMISERLAELDNFITPEPVSHKGSPTKELLEKVEKKIPDLYIEQNDDNELRPVHESIGEALTLIRNGLAKLDHAPGNRLDMGHLADDLGEIIDRLDELAIGELTKGKLEKSFPGISEDVRSLLTAAKKQLAMHMNALEKATGLNPLSSKAIFHSKTFSTIGAQNMLREQLALANEELLELMAKNAPENELNSKREAVNVLRNAVQYLDRRLEQLRYDNSDQRVSSDHAKKLMGSKGADKGIVDEKAEKEVRDFLEYHVDLTGNGDLGLMKKSHPHLREDGFMQVFVEHALRQAKVEVPEDLRTQLQERRFEALNKSEWKPISKQVVMRHGGESHSMTSDVIPQSNLGKHFDDMKGGGVVCHASRNFEHGTTVAVSRLTAPNGEKLFEGVRHGILNCYGISSRTIHELPSSELAKLVENLLPTAKWKKDGEGNPSLDLTMAHIKNSWIYRRQCAREMQQNGSERRVQDLVATNILKNPDRLNKQPINVNLNSIALVTPDHIRSLKGRSGPGNERKMLEGQMKALQKLANEKQPIQMTITNSEGNLQVVSVNITVNAFNFGVNKGAFMAGGKIGLFSGWGTSDNHNAKAMKNLIGSRSDRKSNEDGIGGQVAKYLENKDVPEEKRKIIKQLANQVAKMWDDKSYQTSGKEPYKMVSRLALLSSMIEGDTCWNCKSGKDRTGQMDVETKRLAGEIWMRGEVPEPNMEPDEETKSNRFRMAMDGGNLEIQNYNTGAPGFKLGGVPALAEQMKLHKNDTRYEYFKGIAGFYGT